MQMLVCQGDFYIFVGKETDLLKIEHHEKSY